MFVIAALLFLVCLALGAAIVRGHRKHKDALDVLHEDLGEIAQELRARLRALETRK